MDLYEELQRIVAALDTAGIPYAIAGGLAVSIYTQPRATEDIDLFVKRDDAPRVAAAVAPLGFRAAGVPMRLAQGRLELQRLTKVEGADLLPLDLLSPLDPALIALLEDRHRVEAEGRGLWLVGLGRDALTQTDPAVALRKVAALRSLCRRLPHVPTPAETASLRRFAALEAAPAGATRADRPALRAGFRRMWREGAHADLVALAAALPASLVRSDAELAGYADAARQRCRADLQAPCSGGG